MSDPMKLSNFDVTQQFLGTLVANQANHNRIKNDERGISTVETFKVNKLKKEKGGKKLSEKIGRQILSERQMEQIDTGTMQQGHRNGKREEEKSW